MKFNPINPVPNYVLDNTDKEILRMLMENASRPYSDIARELDVSPGTVHVRMKKLEDAGIVTGAQLLIDYAKIGFDISAYLGVHLIKGSEYDAVVEELRSVPEVTEAYYTTGPYSIFIKIVCKNTQHLYDLLNHKIQPIAGVERTETLICLAESIKRPLPME